MRKTALVTILLLAGGCASKLPANTAVPETATSIPPVDQVQVQIDQQAARDAGITDDDIAQTMARIGPPETRPATADSLDELRAVTVRTVDGRRVHLGDIAAISIVKSPAVSPARQ